MNKDQSFDVSMDVIAKGRPLDEVLSAYQTMFQNAQRVAEQSGATGDECFAQAMQGACYRLYLLGVEDGGKSQ